MIIATAGHVDHGKTALVKNLTGVDTDRLDEEKRRGLSINLGYAYRQTADGKMLGFIDVPGHRRFINTMISGVSGIDLGLMVVAADDGVMPQTREHVQVMQLLGINEMLLVISKCDRSDADRIERVGKEASALLPKETPVFQISNLNGNGIEKLRAELERRARLLAPRTSAGYFRMSVDRAFNLQGRGLILTGTAASGTVSVGDNVVLQPQLENLRVRSIHTQNVACSSASAGERCALNVSSGVHKSDIERGDWVCGDKDVNTTSRFDTRIRLLPDAPFALQHLTDVKLHIGAKRLQAKLIFLRDAGSIASRINPAETAFVQFVTDRPVLCCRGDKFVLRDFGETATLGGGVVLDPRGMKIHKAPPSRLAFLAAMEKDNIEDAIRCALRIEDDFLDYTALRTAWNVDPHATPGFEISDIARIETESGEFWMPNQRWDATKRDIFRALLEFHRHHPGDDGTTVAHLMQIAISKRERPFFQPAIAELIRAGDVLFRRGLLTAKQHRASLVDDAEWDQIYAYLTQCGRQIPNVTQTAEACEMEMRTLLSTLDRAQRNQQVAKLNTNRYALKSELQDFARVALKLTQDGSALSLGALRDELGCGRNILVEVLEHFDRIGFTRRVGSSRIILDRSLPEKKFPVNEKQWKSDVPGGAPGLQNQ